MIGFIFRAIVAIVLAVGGYTTGYNQGWVDGIKQFAKRIEEDGEIYRSIIERQYEERKKNELER